MVKPKRSLRCPGCKAPKNNHSFATPSKHCAGLPSKHEISAYEGVISEEETSPPCLGVAAPPAASVLLAQTTTSLLDAMRHLSLQLEGQTKEQAVMKQRMDDISAGNGPKTIHETSPLPSRSSDNVPEKFVVFAVSGEYVNFSDVLTSLSVLRSAHSDEGMLQSVSGKLIVITRPQRKRHGFIRHLAPRLDQIRNGNRIVTTRALLGTGSIS